MSCVASRLAPVWVSFSMYFEGLRRVVEVVPVVAVERPEEARSSTRDPHRVGERLPVGRILVLEDAVLVVLRDAVRVRVVLQLGDGIDPSIGLTAQEYGCPSCSGTVEVALRVPVEVVRRGSGSSGSPSRRCASVTGLKQVPQAKTPGRPLPPIERWKPRPVRSHEARPRQIQAGSSTIKRARPRARRATRVTPRRLRGPSDLLHLHPFLLLVPYSAGHDGELLNALTVHLCDIQRCSRRGEIQTPPGSQAS